jgi:hypothetical protein
MSLTVRAFRRQRVEGAWWNEDPAQRVGYLGRFSGTMVKERHRKKNGDK